MVSVHVWKLQMAVVYWLAVVQKAERDLLFLTRNVIKLNKFRLAANAV